MQFEPQEQKGNTLNSDPREQPHSYDQSSYYGIPGTGQREDEKLRPAYSSQRPTKARKGFPFLLIALLILAVLAFSGITHAFHSTSFTFPHGPSYGSKAISAHTFKVTGQNTLIVNVDSGSVRVHSGSSDSIVVQSSGNNGPFFGPPDNNSSPISYSQQGETVSVNAQSNHQPFDMQNMDLDISVPNGTTLQINGNSGDVDIENFNGQVSTTTSSGDVKIDNAQLQGQTDIETNSGNIDINGSFDAHGTYRMQTQSGDVHLHVPSNSPVQAITSTNSGDVNNQFDHQGPANGPRAPLSIQTNSGDITIETFGSDQ